MEIMIVGKFCLWIYLACNKYCRCALVNMRKKALVKKYRESLLAEQILGSEGLSCAI
jgi:hypothetical protein